MYIYLHVQKNINRWLEKRKLSMQSRQWDLRVVQSASWQFASWHIHELSSNRKLTTVVHDLTNLRAD